VLQETCAITAVFDEGGVLTLQGVVHLAPEAPITQHAHHAAAPSGPVAVEVALHVSSGEILDARTACCPGGFHSVLGCFCPCVSALLLQAAAADACVDGLRPGPASALPAHVVRARLAENLRGRMRQGCFQMCTQA
jgi:hypothetical protein